MNPEERIKFLKDYEKQNEVLDVHSQEYKERDCGRYVIVICSGGKVPYKRMHGGKWEDRVGPFSFELFIGKSYSAMCKKREELIKHMMDTHSDYPINPGTKNEIVLFLNHYCFRLEELVYKPERTCGFSGTYGEGDDD